MTPYDAWKTNVEDTNEEAWEDAVVEVSKGISPFRLDDIIDKLALSDDVLTWLSHAVVVPQHHQHAFRDLSSLVGGLRKEVETEMKANRSYPDED